MHPWHDVPFDPARASVSIPVVIEIPRGDAHKYELDKETGMLRLDRVLHSAVHYPADYGFVPRTLGDDGDPIDVLVLGQDPLPPLCLLEARPVGMLVLRDEAGRDEKIIAVRTRDPAWSGINHHDQLPSHVVDQIDRFFRDYKILEHKEVEVGAIAGPEAATTVLQDAARAYGLRFPRAQP